MNDPKLRSSAMILAGKTPPHLDQPILPLVSWWVEGDNLYIHLADGRKIHAPLADQNQEQTIKMVVVPASHIHDNKKEPPPVVKQEIRPLAEEYEKIRIPKPDPVTILPVRKSPGRPK